MASKIVWLSEAVGDLEEIVRFIDSRSESYGSIVAATLLEAAESLTELPNRGALIREDVTERHRHLICYSYRVIYRVESDYVFIVGVIHGARLLPDAVLQRGPSRA
jgi:toxin ParE1/3/4